MRLRHFVGVSLMSAATVLVMLGVLRRGDVRRAGVVGRGDAVGVRAVDYPGAMGAGAVGAGAAGFAGSGSAVAGAVAAGADRFAGPGLAAAGPTGAEAAGPADFVEAARTVVPATVRVVAGGGDQQGVVSGSGVILSEDGYIVTNNHVIDGGGPFMVTLSNRKTLRAVLVGSDPNTDMAVLKIDAANLPFLLYGNSDDVKVGQWVLAVGYPLFLQVTATAGIVSAMGRNLGASLGRPASGGVNRLDSFIQTDAAVNLGNSGGPLVNRAGQLIGINTAMATPTGAYTGYSFAIPVRIVRRVVNELIAHGTVKKG